MANAPSRLDKDEKLIFNDTLITEEMCLDWYCCGKNDILTIIFSLLLIFGHCLESWYELNENSEDNLLYHLQNYYKGRGLTMQPICQKDIVVVPIFTNTHVWIITQSII